MFNVKLHLLSVGRGRDHELRLFRLLHREDVNVLFVAGAACVDKVADNLPDCLAAAADS